jgi:7tm Chemosensory receptor
MIGSLIVGLILPITFFGYMMDRVLIKVPLFIYSSFYFCLSIGNVSGNIGAICTRLMSMTEFLEIKLVSKTDEKNQNVKSLKKRNDVDDYTVLAEIYQLLMDSVDNINVCYSFQMMLGFGLVFFTTLFTSFSSYVDIYDKGYLTPVTITAIAFCLYFNFFLSVVIMTCVQLDDRVKTKVR